MTSQVMLVGAGVVGRAIALDHLLAGLPIWLVDRDVDAVAASCDWVLERSESTAESASPWGARVDLPMVFIRPNEWLPSYESRADDSQTSQWLLIESIAERLEIKQAFFAEAETWFDRPPILTSNTSTLSIEKISQSMQRPERLVGLHFFMPVIDRHAVEIISGPATDSQVIDECCCHAQRLAKNPLLVRDGPGFVVNRILSPYLNLAMWLLCGGVDDEVIARAAAAYGMPMSPLELVDLIGPRTAFDGGRTVWQAFPHRMDPSPLLPALVKQKLTGVQSGRGFYYYDDEPQGGGQFARDGQVSPDGRGLTSEARELITRYAHEDFVVPFEANATVDSLVKDLFAAVIHWESVAIVRDGIADGETIRIAMREGLAWRRSPDWQNVESSPQAVLSPDRLQWIANQFPHIRSVQAIS